MTTITYMKSLTELLNGMVPETISLADISVSGIGLDSREVNGGELFLSLSVDLQHRYNYLQQAMSMGVTAVVFDANMPLSDDELMLIESTTTPAYPVAALAQKAGEIAARFYNDPSSSMTVIAVTGTNGKTSVSQFIAQGLAFLDYQYGIIGTLGVGLINQLKTTGMTTPDPVTLQGILADFRDQGVNYVVLEASSHALDQGRLNSVAIDVAILTNLSRDHLDYHGDMVAYARAKKMLFEFQCVTKAVINIGDEFGRSVVSTLAENNHVFLYSYSSQSDSGFTPVLQAVDVKSNEKGLCFSVITDIGEFAVTSSLLGRFNVDNLLATLGALLALDIDMQSAINAINHCRAVEGRMQKYSEENMPTVVIDFAHTPDALAQALSSLRQHLASHGELWCVFGCGGDRDKGKRPLMGMQAECYADHIVITADNPRSESNDSIVADIVSGMSEKANPYIEHDRQLAIEYAIKNAHPIDIVLVAGKGHEQYQEILNEKIPFCDKAVVTKALTAANDETLAMQGMR